MDKEKELPAKPEADDQPAAQLKSDDLEELKIQALDDKTKIIKNYTQQAWRRTYDEDRYVKEFLLYQDRVLDKANKDLNHTLAKLANAISSTQELDNLHNHYYRWQARVETAVDDNRLRKGHTFLTDTFKKMDKNKIVFLETSVDLVLQLIAGTTWKDHLYFAQSTAVGDDCLGCFAAKNFAGNEVVTYCAGHVVATQPQAGADHPFTDEQFDIFCGPDSVNAQTWSYINRDGYYQIVRGDCDVPEEGKRQLYLGTQFIVDPADYTEQYPDLHREGNVVLDISGCIRAAGYLEKGTELIFLAPTAEIASAEDNYKEKSSSTKKKSSSTKKKSSKIKKKKG